METEELIQAEMRGGKKVEDAVQVVKKRNPLIENELVESAKDEINSKPFNDKLVQDAIHSIAPYLGSNPRKIKRFINIFRLQILIASRRGLLAAEVIQVEFLAKWLIITTRWPDVVEGMLQDKSFLSNLKVAYEAKEQLRELRREGIKKDDEALERAYQARIDYHSTNPYVSRLIAASELMILLNQMTNTELLNYLHFTRTTL
ncbi:MAG: hypothetical protein NVSMB54_00010 [Ktedonobacteraceae bacterium]